MGSTLLTRAQVVQVLDYDANTGIFVWKQRNTRGPRLEGKLAGYLLASGYRLIRIHGKKYYAHRLAWLIHSGEWPKWDIDHINGNPSDNRICNLRDVTTALNLQNQRKATMQNKSSGLLGVTRGNSDSTWVAQIKTNGKSIRIGIYSCKFEAHEAYKKSKRELHPTSTI